MLRKTCERLLMVGMVLSSAVGCDQTTKRIAEFNLLNNSYSFFFDTIRLHHIKNTGAFLGLGSHYSEFTKLIIFILLPAIFLLAASFYIAFKSHLTHAQVVLTSLVVGGGFGNLIDRVFLNGHVTDFINIGIGSLRTGIFNIADVAIMFGAFGLFFLGLKNDSKTKISA